MIILKRILVGYLTNGNNSGINKYLFNFIKQISSKKDYEIDVISSDVGDILKENLKDYKCKLYEIPKLKHPYKRYKAICKIIKDNKYDVVYSNISESFNCCTVLAAHKYKVKRIVVHSHATGSSEENTLKRFIRVTLNKLFRIALHNSANVFVACSKEAGKWLFFKKDYKSKKFHVINNTIDFNEYTFDEKKREKIRKDLNISNNDVVLGNVGNFEYSKNQMFILQTLKELLKRNNNYKFILVGDGRLKDEFKEYVKNEGLTKNVIFTGIITNVNEVLNAMDIFVFPSVIEGFGIVALESQVNGLPTIISDKVPNKVIISKNIYQLPLEMSDWCDMISDLSSYKRTKAKLLDNAYQYDNSNIEQFKYIIGDDIK